MLLAPSTVVAPMLQILVWTSTFVSLFLYWSSIPLQQLPNVFWYKQMNHFAGLLDEPVRHPVIVIFFVACAFSSYSRALFGYCCESPISEATIIQQLSCNCCNGVQFSEECNAAIASQPSSQPTPAKPSQAQPDQASQPSQAASQKKHSSPSLALPSSEHWPVSLRRCSPCAARPSMQSRTAGGRYFL